MHRARNQLLAYPGFADDEHGGAGRCRHPIDGLGNLQNHARAAQHGASAEPGHLAAQPIALLQHRTTGEQSRQRALQRFELDWLLKEVARSGAHCGYGRGNVRKSGEHDHARMTGQIQIVGQRLQAAATGQVQIEQHDIHRCT